MIQLSFLSQGYLFTNDDFRVLTLRYYFEKHPDYDPNCDFTCSNGFIADFRLRNRFSSRKHHYKRRPNITEEDIREWTARLSELLVSMDHDRIVNGDETNWMLFAQGLLTWRNQIGCSRAGN
jgi:hypothetical protein